MNLLEVPQAPPDAIFGVADAYRADAREDKINLTVGAYRDDNGKPTILPSVSEAERRMLESPEGKEYLPITGDPAYNRASIKLLYGDSVEHDKVAVCQTIGGTSSLRVASEFLSMFMTGERTVYMTDPTWGNQRAVFKKSGFALAPPLPYYNASSRSFNFEGVLAALKAAPERSLVLMHSCCHNPTGCDPSVSQWDLIEAACADKGHTMVLDSAYLGFGSGNPDTDAAAIRLFASRGRVPLIVCQSYSKNFSLYGERVGTVTVVCPNATAAKSVNSQLAKIIRPMFSNPPRHGAAIIKTILGDAQLEKQWLSELAGLAGRIKQMRQSLYDELVRLGTPGDWNHVLNQIGMFTFTGLTADQVMQMREQHGVYMLSNGRISVAGLNSSNVARFAKAVNQVVTSSKSAL